MGLKQKSSDLRKRMRDALKGGGDVAIEKQKAIGKLTARERIVSLLDPKSFHEYDLFVEHAGKDFDMDKKYLPGDGVLTGTGLLAGHPVCIFAQDFTVAGGSLGWMHAKKITKIMDHALKLKVPLIGINEQIDDNALLVKTSDGILDFGIMSNNIQPAFCRQFLIGIKSII